MTQLPLRSRTGEIVAHTQVDAADAEQFAHARLYLTRTGYVGMSLPKEPGRGHWVLFHRVIAGAKRGERVEVDHINGDRLDNRRSNLRLVDGATNRRNVRGRGADSSHRGVFKRKDAPNKWQARAVYLGEIHRLGSYETEAEAAAVVVDFWAERGIAVRPPAEARPAA